MALVKCHECGKDISTEALACPNCGAPTDPSKKQTLSAKEAGSPILGLIVLILIVGIVISTCSSDDGAKKGASKAEAQCAKDDCSAWVIRRLLQQESIAKLR